MGQGICVILNRIIEEWLLIRWHLIKDLQVAREAISYLDTRKAFPARESNKCKDPETGICFGVFEKQ